MRILILLHAADPYPRVAKTMIWYLAERWRDRGLEVLVHKGGHGEPPAADVVVPALDLTRIPDPYVALLDRYSRVLNRRLVDIAKRAISPNLVESGSPWDGPVIVKTDRNYGGLPEALVEQRVKGAAISLHERPWRRVTYLDPNRYPIFPRLAEVPAGVWRNPALIVERFLPERQGESYVGRALFCLGDATVDYLQLSRRPIVKGDGIYHVEVVETLPEVLAYRERIGLDFGKIDYLLPDGELTILDVNRTPGRVRDESINVSLGDALAGGIDVYR